MDNKYLNPKPGCGGKILKNFTCFSHQIITLTHCDPATNIKTAVQNSTVDGSYEVEGTWHFNNQFGTFFAEFDAVNGIKKYKSGIGSVGIQLNTDPESPFPFGRPLTVNNDTSLKDLMNLIIP